MQVSRPVCKHLLRRSQPRFYSAFFAEKPVYLNPHARGSQPLMLGASARSGLVRLPARH